MGSTRRHRKEGKRPSAGEKPGAILAAALEVVVERGFHATNVPLVAERAGVSVGTLYHYCANKEAIANELYRGLRLCVDRQVMAGTHETMELERLSGVLKPVHDEVLAAFIDGAVKHLVQAAACCWIAGAPPPSPSW